MNSVDLGVYLYGRIFFYDMQGEGTLSCVWQFMICLLQFSREGGLEWRSVMVTCN